MKKMKTVFIKYCQQHDYLAALDFLKLLYPRAKTTELADLIEKSKTIIKKAKDIYRASGLPLLPKQNEHVVRNLEKFKKEKSFQLSF